MSSAKRLLRRGLAGLVVLWSTATLIFLAVNLSPGDTATMILGGPDALPTPAAIRQVRVEYGLDQPLYLQYAHYLLRLAHGDLGESYRLHVPVSRLIGQQIGATATLACSATIVGFLVAIALALLTARRGRRLAFWFDTVELTGSSIPVFVLGLLLLLVFSFTFHLFPASSTHGWTSIILPMMTLAVPIATVLAQVLRRELNEVLEQPFIVTARSRGLSETGVRLGHALRHALVPIMTLSGMLFLVLISDAVVVETVFNRQGLGRLAADATSNRDVPLIVGVALVAAAATVTVNILIDALYGLVDPRMEGA